jgi:hypothetical protein
VAYTVFIDDNFHYQDESERVNHGLFETADEAVAARRSIVDDFLAGAFKPGMSATALYGLYTSFGDDPFVVCPLISKPHRWPSQRGIMRANGAKCWTPRPSSEPIEVVD